jgi:phosphate butyryltransferase
MIRDFDRLIEIADNMPEKRLVVVSAHDRNTLEGVYHACNEGFVTPVLLGREDRIREIIAEEEMIFPRLQIINCSDDGEAASEAVAMIVRGEGDVLMKGVCKTADLLRAVVSKETGLLQGGLISHVSVCKVPRYHKIIALTDGGMVPHPTLKQKAELIINAVELMHSLGYEEPKVACLAGGEDVNPKAPETVEGAALKAMNQRGELPGCLVEGPISYDLAMSKEAAKLKGYGSPVAGEADILLVPNMATGNILAKSWTVSGGGTMSGLVVGAKVPIVVVSRSASSEEKFLSIALAVAAAK